MATVTEQPQVDDVRSQASEHDDFIDSRLERTAFHLKTLDLVTGLIWMGLAIFGSLLVLVLIDHWIVGLGFWARAISLIAVIAGGLYVGIRHVLLPLTRSINPEYAAVTVEQSHPEFKNGLISYLFFRDRADEIRPGVYEGIKRQTIGELNVVPIDSAVDRSQIIKLGYVLVGLAALWVGYILFSPKSPFQTLERIATPWRDIARPSQVDILDVQPGSQSIFRGQTVEVTARIEGLKEEHSPAIQFATLDGQLVDQRIPLTQGNGPNVFVGELTMGGQGGIQQDLEYRIVAGDAVGPLYEVHVTEAPHIAVERVEYDFPSYTEQSDEVVPSEGDVRAIEGTRVTVVGKANQPIKRGYIEFLMVESEANSEKTVATKRAPLKVFGDDKQAKVQFVMRLDEKRTGSLYRGYRLHFENADGELSVDPVEHTLETIPDRRPVVQILTPDRRTIEIPENSIQQIEIRAVDPDFKLSRVQLAGRTRTRRIFNETLLTTAGSSEWVAGQFVKKYNFIPRKLGLKEGDSIEYLAMAEDNKQAFTRDKLDPNRTVTAKQYIRIVAADPMAEKPPKDAQTEQEPENRNPQQDQDEKQSGKKQSGDKQSGEKQTGEKKSGEQQGDEQQPEEGQSGESGEPDEQEQGGGESQEQEGGLQQKSEGGGEAQEQSNGSGSPGDSNDSESESSSGQSGNSGDDTGEESGEQNSESGESGDSPSNSELDPNSSENADDEPLPSSGERDGEVVERIREHMKQNGELDEYEKQQRDQQGSESPDEGQGSGEQESGEQPDNETGSEQPSEGESNGEQDGQDADGQDSSGQNGEEATGDETGSPEQQEGGTESGNESQSGESQSDDSQDQTGEKASGDQSGDSGQSGEKSGEKGDDSGEAGTNGDQQNQTGKNGDSSEGGDAGEKKGDQQSGKPSGDSTGQQPGEKETGETGSEPTGDQNAGENNSGDDEGESSGDQDSTDSQDGDPSNEGPESGDDNQTSGDQQGNKPNNEHRHQEGKGQDGENGEDSSDPSSRESQSDQGQSSSSDDSSSAKSGEAKGENQKTGPSKNGSTGDQKASPKPNQSSGGEAQGGETLAGDEANLEYAREATDMVLEYLKDQKEKPNPELLDDLGWDQGDVEKFIDRWNKMKRNAKGPGPQAEKSKSKLDDMLKGMGLEAPESRLRRAVEKTDAQRNNRNTGRKTKVPSELLNPFRAFQRGLQKRN